MKTKARDIVEVLKTKHSDDIFIDECKSGSTWFDSHLRLDAWAMKRKWNPISTYGYEVKVSRSDFLNDDKWHGYLEYCNQFYFVCPSGLILPEELGEGAGLMWLSKTGTRLFTKIKAPYRELLPSSEMLMYILFARVKVLDRWHVPKPDNISKWKNWLLTKDENKELGYNVSKKIRQLVKERIEKVENRNQKIESETEKLVDIRQFLESIDVDIHSYSLKNRVQETLNAILPSNFIAELRTLRTQISDIEDNFNKLKSGKQEKLEL